MVEARIYYRVMGAGLRVIEAVERQFGAELGPGLAERADELGRDARAMLLAEVQQALLWRPDDERPLGHVRPFVYRSYGQRILLGSMTRRNGSVPLPRLEHLLLYFHSVAVFDTLAPVLARDLETSDLSWALCWLDRAAPLIRAGLLVLCDSRIKNREETQRHKATLDEATELTELEDQQLWREMCTITGEDSRADEEEPLGDGLSIPPLSRFARALAGLASAPHQLDVALWDARTALEAALSPAGRATDLWMTDLAYSPALAKILSKADARINPVTLPPSSRFDVMSTLSHVSLPAIAELSVSDLVAIRKNEELFEDWRNALAGALGELPVSKEPSAAQLATAHESLREGSAVLTGRIQRLSRDLLTGEMRDFGISAVASATSGALFGMKGLAAAITASGMASAIRGVHGAAKVHGDKQQIESARRHYAVFAPDR